MVVVEVEDVADAVEVDAVAVDAVAVVATAATVVVATAVVDPMVRFTPPAVTVIGPFKHSNHSVSILSPSIHTHTHEPPTFVSAYTYTKVLQHVQRSIGSCKTYRNAYILDRIITTYVPSSF